jgi:DNA-binding NarL/FixJ family response regulator
MDAMVQIGALLPDVTILDCRLRGVEGAQVAMEIQRRGLPTRVLAFSAHLEDHHLRKMMEAGAVGYLLKEESAEVIVAAIRAAARGEGWFSPEVVSRMAAWAGGESLKPTGPTRRELEILELIAKGRTNADIAKALNITERTVAFHVESLLAKLSASTAQKL